MADFYVSVDGNNVNSGADWANAKRDLSNVLAGARAAGDRVFCRHQTAANAYQETAASASITLNSGIADATPVEVYACKGGTSATPPTDSDIVTDRNSAELAHIETTTSGNVVLSGDLYFWGFHFDPVDDLTHVTNNGLVICEQCHIELPGNASGYSAGSAGWRAQTRWLNCKLTLGGTGSGNYLNLDHHTFEWIGGELVSPTSATVLINNSFHFKGTFIGVDLDALGASDNLITSHQHGNVGDLNIIGCQVDDANVTEVQDTPTGIKRFGFWSYGSDTAIGSNEFNTAFHVRDHAGQSDHEPTFALNADTKASTTGKWSLKLTVDPAEVADVVQPLRSIPILVFVEGDGTSKTLTIEFLREDSVAQPAQLNDGNCWLDIWYPSASGLEQYDIASTRVTPLGTATNLTASTESWAGSPANTRTERISQAIAPDYHGWVYMIVNFSADDGDELYVDPAIDVDGVKAPQVLPLPGSGIVNIPLIGGLMRGVMRGV